MGRRVRIGVDLGGTKIEALAIDDAGRELRRLRIPTPAGDYHATLHAIARLATELESELNTRASIGVGTPGSLSPGSGLLRNSNSVCLNDQPLDRDLEKLLHRPVRLANDADCFALSEARDGRAQGAGIVFGVILGTGVGGALVVDGHLLSGPNAIAGEWGHNPLPWPRDDERPGAICYCGRSGCIETFLSGPAMQQQFTRATGQVLDAAGITALSTAGDRHAEACVQRYEDRLARALAHVINIVDPDVVVLGGGLSNTQRLYQNVPALWEQYIFSDVVLTRLEPAAHGDSGGVRGAAWLWD